MKYRNPDIVSSYRKNDLGKTLYDVVLMTKPSKIIEFGSLYGYSAICMAMALHEVGKGGYIFSFDNWSNIAWANGSLKQCEENACRYGVTDFITFGQKDFGEWSRERNAISGGQEEFDLLHVDINNDGSTVKELQQLSNPKNYIIFEGGSKARDEVYWMEKKDKIVGSCEYTILNPMFPSLSAL